MHLISLIWVGLPKKIPPCMWEPQAPAPLCLRLHISTPSWASFLSNGSAHHRDLATLEGPCVSFLCIPDPFSYSAVSTLQLPIDWESPLEPTPNRSVYRTVDHRGSGFQGCPNIKQTFYFLNLLSHLESEISTQD